MNFICFGLVLNFFVFYYEIENNFLKVCELVKMVFDDVIVKLDDVKEDFYKDSILIM